MSRGSFYTFFETPEKVLEEVAFQCMQESAGLLGDMLQAAPVTHWHNIIDAKIEFYIDCYRQPVIRELWAGQHLTPPARTADREWMQDVAHTLRTALNECAPAFSLLSLGQGLAAIEICERLFQYAYTDEASGDQSIIDEIRIMLIQ